MCSNNAVFRDLWMIVYSEMYRLMTGLVAALTFKNRASYI